MGKFYCRILERRLKGRSFLGLRSSGTESAGYSQRRSCDCTDLLLRPSEASELRVLRLRCRRVAQSTALRMTTVEQNLLRTADTMHQLYCSPMKSVIVGTAGHIDHGKTALVKALTGIDADRLEEEKRRGITIDIGFANLELPMPGGETLRLGFVDVPGHERFVRNMLAGVGGIDLVLLVIAADESIKPQTREHFDICRLLSVRRGITVLTKSDVVDRETLEVVRAEVRRLSARVFS